MQTAEWGHSIAKPLVVILALSILAFHLVSAGLGRSLFRASHLGTALTYADGPINLFRPTVVGFNATGTPTAQEFPVWQALAGLLFKAANSRWYGLANLVSLVLFATGLWPLLQLARDFVGPRASWWVLAFFLAQPLIVFHAGEASVDGFCLAASLWFLFCTNQLVRSKHALWLLPTIAFGSLSALTKLPFFMAAGLCSACILWVHTRRDWRRWALLLVAGAVAGAAFWIWTQHTARLASQADYPFAELRVSRSRFMSYWYFGDLHYRLGAGHWIKGAWRFLHGAVGSLPVGVLLLVSLLRAGNVIPKLWLLACLLTTLVFTHLVLEHWHYYLMFCPAVALLCGSALSTLADAAATQFRNRLLRVALASALLMGSCIEGLVAMKLAINYDDFPRRISEIIRQKTGPEDKLIIYSEDVNWGGEELFRSGRKGLSVFSLQGSPESASPKGLLDLLGNPHDFARLTSLGYNTLVLVSESPVRFAVQAANPGASRARRFYPKSISAAVDAWPVVYASEDLLIKRIPSASP